MDCAAANFILQRHLISPNAPPFLGLLEMKEATTNKAVERTRAFLAGRSERLPQLFYRYPYLSTWLVARALNDSYGDVDRKIYSVIEGILGVPIDTQATRRELHNAFRQVCRRLGLPSAGFDDRVKLYLLHAGVSKAQLPQLIEAFIRQHDLFGPPPRDSSEVLSRWENDALEFLPQAIVTPRRAILWDETGWHASLYARIAQDPDTFQPSTSFEKAFLELYRKAQVDVRRAAVTRITPPRPRLHWGPDGLVLRLPRAERRIPVLIDTATRPLRLKGGEDWLLEQPWPRRLHVEIDSLDVEIVFLQDAASIAIFDMTTGQMLVERRPTGPGEIDLDASDVLIASRSPFAVSGEAANALGDGCFVLRAALGPRGQTFVSRERTLSLRAKPRRRLTLQGGEIASGHRGKLFGPAAMILVETGQGMDELRAVRLSIGEAICLVDVQITDGRGELSLADCPLPAQVGSPCRLRLELMAPAIADEEPRPSGITLDAWIWMDFRGAHGLAWRSVPSPANFLGEQSNHVTASPDGLQLEAAGGYAHATAAFGIEGEVISFRLPWPDITLHRHRIDGSIVPVQIGARIGVGQDDRFGHLSIRCPDPAASLRWGGRDEASPFKLGMTRNIALSELLGRGQGGSVVLRRSSGAEVLLFEVVDVLEPTRFEIRPGRNGLDLKLAFGTRIDAIGLEAEDELGQRAFHTVALGRWPTREAPPAWLQARLSGDAREVTLSIQQQAAEDGLRIGRVFLRPETARPDESWRPLRNARGDTFAVPLTTAQGLEAARQDHIKTRYETLSRWLSDCYASECWLGPGLERNLLPRWRSLGQTITGLPLGAGLIISASLAPSPEETSASFVPLVHPVELDAALYSAVPSAFISLGEFSEVGVQAIARMARLSQGGLRDGILHPQALMAFSNFRQAESTGETLAGFNVETFFSLFGPFDIDPSAGWFWHGTPLLGPGHLRAAALRMVERLEAAGVIIGGEPGTGGNSRRRDALASLTNQVWAQIPPRRHPPMPKRQAEDDRPVPADLWIAATLSEFAAASRNGSASQFIDTLGKDLGWDRPRVLSSLSFILRLAPELFFHFLLIWQLAKVRA